MSIFVILPLRYGRGKKLNHHTKRTPLAQNWRDSYIFASQSISQGLWYALSSAVKHVTYEIWFRFQDFSETDLRSSGRISLSPIWLNMPKIEPDAALKLS